MDKVVQLVRGVAALVEVSTLKVSDGEPFVPDKTRLPPLNEKLAMTGMGGVATEIEPSTARLLFHTAPAPETTMVLPVRGWLKIWKLSPATKAGPRFVPLVCRSGIGRVPVTTTSLLLGERDLLMAIATLPAIVRLLLIVNVPRERPAVPAQRRAGIDRHCAGDGARAAKGARVDDTEPVPVPLPLVLLMSNVPALMVVLPV